MGRAKSRREGACASRVDTATRLFPEKMLPGLIVIPREKCGLPLRHCLLTFDDGPAGATTEAVLLVLREFGVKACFCVVGSQVAARPEQVQTIAADGHLLVNHTFHHRYADLWDFRRFESDLIRCDEVVASATAGAPRPLLWFRPPFGLLTTPVREIAVKRRILPVTHFPFDTWFNSPAPRRAVDWIINHAQRHQGGIYVLHDGLIGSPVSSFLRPTANRAWVPQAVRQMLQRLFAVGFQFPEPSNALHSLALPR